MDTQRKQIDVGIQDEGDCWFFFLHTPAAMLWVDEHTQGATRVGDAIIVEPRFVNDLAEGMMNAGLELR